MELEEVQELLEELTLTNASRETRCAELEEELQRTQEQLVEESASSTQASEQASDNSQLKTNLQKAIVGFKKSKAIAEKQAARCKELEAKVSSLSQQLSEEDQQSTKIAKLEANAEETIAQQKEELMSING